MPRSDASAALPLLGRLKLRQLALVVAIDTHRSLRKAAEAVAVTQPAATRLLHELEAALGVPLFVRHAVGHGADRLRRRVHPLRAKPAVGSRGGAARAARARGRRARRAAGRRGDRRRAALARARDHRGSTRPAGAARVHPGQHERRPRRCADRRHARRRDGRLPATADARLLDAQPLAEEPLCIVARSGHPLVRGGRCVRATSPMRTGSSSRRAARRGRKPTRCSTGWDCGWGSRRWRRRRSSRRSRCCAASDALSAVPEDLAAHYGAPGWLGRVPIAWRAPAAVTS